MHCQLQHTVRWSWAAALLVMLGAMSFAMGADADQQAAQSAALSVTNALCPVTSDEPIDPDQWVMYEGKRVYFCCPTCKRKFERNPTAYLANLPQFASTSVKVDDPHEGHVHESNGTSIPVGETADDDHHHGAADEAASAATDEPDHHASENAAQRLDDMHDHATHGDESRISGLTRLIAWLGNFHPAAVNFPIALLISGAIAEMLMIATGRTLFSDAARFSVWLGSVSAVGAVILGWFFAGFRLSDPDWIMTVHRWLGTATGAWALLVLALCIAAYRSDDARRRWLAWYRVALFIGAAAVGANAFFGGALVYGIGHYAW